MNARLRTRGPGHRTSAGFTLVEMLVAVTIGMALTLAVTVMLVRYESGRRSLTAQNDSSIGGAYVAYSVDRMLRSAGSGYAQAWRNSFGCRIMASRAGTTTLPRAAAFPAPFATVPQAVRLAPVVVHAGLGTDGSDVISVATGASGLGESPLRVLPGSATATGLRVPATVGLKGNDLVLVFQEATDCMVQQVDSAFAGGAGQQIDFGGTYADDDISGTLLTGMGATDLAWVAALGNTANNRPSFQLLGVDANATLVAHDMLQMDGSDAVVPIADGVADLRARYGVDTNDDGRIDSWQDPATAPWDAATLLDGTTTSRLNLSRIVAVRVGVLMRSNLPERDAVSASSVKLFSDLGSALEVTRTLTSAEQKMRWRPLEFTVPMRNMMLIPRP
jgi:type IV pilus assembly protein PilW